MDSPPARPAITVTNLARVFHVGRRSKKREIRAVDGVSFRVDAGERVAFIGPNGAGKSTSIKMLTGILHPTSGDAEVLGLVPWRQRGELARHIGAVFGQRSQLWQELPPRTTYRLLATIYGLDQARLDQRLGQLGEQLEATDLFDQPARTLSLGQRMRCELAACLLHEPSLLFLDEPSIGLDLVAKQQFRQLLVDINEQVGCTIFLTSHDVSDIEHVADRAIIVNHGTIIYDDSVEAMRRTLLRTKRVDVTFESAVVDGFDSLTGRLPGISPSAVSVEKSTPTSAVIEVDTSRCPVRVIVDELLKGGRLVDLTVVDPPLEHVIGEIYQRPKDGR